MEEEEVGLTTPSPLGQRSREAPNCPHPSEQAKVQQSRFPGRTAVFQPHGNGRSLSLQIGVRRLWAKEE